SPFPARSGLRAAIVALSVAGDWDVARTGTRARISETTISRGEHRLRYRPRSRVYASWRSSRAALVGRRGASAAVWWAALSAAGRRRLWLPTWMLGPSGPSRKPP